MIPNNEFTFPKSVHTVYDCLYAVLRDRENAVVLDYFAGSGTTGHALLMLNHNMNKHHRFILCTNNDVGEAREKEYIKKYGEIDFESEEWEKWKQTYGIASSVTYPRLKSAIKGFVHTKDFKNILFQKKLTPAVLKKMNSTLSDIDEIIKKNESNYDEVKMEVENDTVVVLGVVKKGKEIEGIPANLKYYKTDFVEKDDEELIDSLLEHIVEMIQLQYGVAVDGEKYVMIMDDDEMDSFEKNFEKYSQLEAVFINQDVLLSASQEKMLGAVNTYTIPDCYFDFELREAGEIW